MPSSSFSFKVWTESLVPNDSSKALEVLVIAPPEFMLPEMPARPQNEELQLKLTPKKRKKKKPPPGSLKLLIRHDIDLGYVEKHRRRLDFFVH